MWEMIMLRFTLIPKRFEADYFFGLHLASLISKPLLDISEQR